MKSFPKRLLSIWIILSFLSPNLSGLKLSSFAATTPEVPTENSSSKEIETTQEITQENTEQTQLPSHSPPESQSNESSTSTMENSRESSAVESNINQESTAKENTEQTETEGETQILPPSEQKPRQIYASISGMINTADAKNICILPATDGSIYQSFPGTAAGFQSALFELYQNGAGGDYTIYIGTSITAPAAVAADTATATSASDVSFRSLTGKVNELALVGSITDPTTTTNAAPTDATTLTLNTSIYFGTHLTMRNIKYNFSNFYMNAHNLFLAHGSSDTATGASIYGGARIGDVTGDVSITIESTGTAAFLICGGNQSGGTLTGNINVTIHNTSNAISAFYGGGRGTASAPSHVKGNITTTINQMSGQFPNPFYGGCEYGNISGSITNHISGPGKSLSGAYFYGGSR
ncbi:hypothetical protein FACS189418_9030 [Clostridia bacterium]|nr:hypothetical protein FACS189418_9030 [Clostridia bacterium]